MNRYIVLIGILMLASCSSKNAGENNFDSSDVPLAPSVSGSQNNSPQEISNTIIEKKNPKYPDPATLDMKNITARPWSPPPEER